MAAILIEKYKEGGLAEYDLDYDTFSQIYSHLIYFYVAGFGRDGPDATRAGYDFMIQGMSGLMSVTS